jgi:hypothetical protein
MKSLKVGLTNGRVWERITALARQNAKKSFVAVAYFGANGADLLPLSKGSWLAVDASEAAVKSGQTCPTALIKLQRNGVRIFSVNHLHAKLFVFGRIGIVGSANASANSANLLIESTITFASSRDVNAAITFIRDECCLLELEPERLVQLSKLYRPPLSAGSRSTSAWLQRCVSLSLKMLMITSQILHSSAESGTQRRNLVETLTLKVLASNGRVRVRSRTATR